MRRSGGPVSDPGYQMPPDHLAVVMAVTFSMCPRNILEWGSGLTTQLFCEHFPSASVTSIEHDQCWARMTGAQWLPDRDQYTGWPAQDRRVWDVVLVDGRWRSRCLRAARPFVHAGGIVFLHDAEREYYHEATKEYSDVLRVRTSDGTGRELWLLKP